MSKDDIDRAVKEAEKFADEDKKQRRKLSTSRNEADQMVLSERKDFFDDNRRNVSDDEKDVVRSAIDKLLKETVKSGTTDAIKADTEALQQAFYKISEKLYAQSGAQGAAGRSRCRRRSRSSGLRQRRQYYNADFEDKTDNKIYTDVGYGRAGGGSMASLCPCGVLREICGILSNLGIMDIPKTVVL